MAVVSEDRFHCIKINQHTHLHLHLNIILNVYGAFMLVLCMLCVFSTMVIMVMFILVHVKLMSVPVFCT